MGAGDGKANTKGACGVHRYSLLGTIVGKFGVAKWDLLVPTDSEGHRGYWYSSSMHLVSISRSYVSKEM